MNYNRMRCKIFLIWLFAIHLSVPIHGQNKEDLQKEKEKTLEDINYTNKLLEETQQNRRTNLNRIRITNKRISLRNEVIANINKQINELDGRITEIQDLVVQMGKDYDKIKEEYKKIVYYTYWNRNEYNRLMFLLSASNFNQAYKRLKYLQQLTEFRREQAEEITMMKELMEEKRKELIAIRTEKENLLGEKQRERDDLQKERTEKTRIVDQLKRQETRLRREILEKEETAQKIEKEIEAIIAEERRKASLARGNRKLTPEEQLISDNFMGNRGRLPWPTERGIVTNKYGKHAHPVLPGITINNPGVDITTVEGADVRCLYEGEVTRVIPVLGENFAVIVRHGDYLTVYGNIVNVSVKKGDMVETKQKIGKVYTDEETKNTILHIEIWKELEKQNPEIWMSPSKD